MTKEQLSKLLHDTGCPVNEGVSSIKNEKQFPRIDYWESLWSGVKGSGEDYSTISTWQIDFYARVPRHPKLLWLRDKLNEMDLYPAIMHEFNIEDRIWHSAFTLEIDEDKTSGEEA